MNYFKSEEYRIHRKKSLYLTTGIILSLVIAIILVLYFSFLKNPAFTYGTNSFLYASVLNTAPIILIVSLLFSRQLLGQDKSTVKQSVAFGISRNQIFFTKLIITFIDFLFLCVLSLLIIFISGEFLLKADPGWSKQFFISITNLTPLITAGFVMGYTFMLLLNNEVVSVLLPFIFFNNLFEKILRLIENKLWGHGVLANYAPHFFLEKNVTLFSEKNANLSFDYWFYSFIIISITLAIALPLFNKKDI